MSTPLNLVTEQDIHAYVDGELSGERRDVVEAFLAERDLPLQRAARYLRSNFDLRVLRAEIYKDSTLKAEVDRLLSRLAMAPV